MSVHVSHSSHAVLVSVRPAGREDSLGQVLHLLGNLVCLDRPVVLDLSEVTMAPTARISDFLQRVADARSSTGCPIVLVAGRQTARRLLHQLSPEPPLPVVASLDLALRPDLLASRPLVGHLASPPGRS